MPDFDASASAAGYLYQARLALALSLRHVNGTPGIEVSIEQLDDVAFESDGTPFELLQTKHRIARAAGLSDASPDVWKTLRIWSTAVRADPSLASRVRFQLVTTGVAPDGSAAAHLRPAIAVVSAQNRDPEKAAELLTQVANASKNADLQAAFRAFLDLTPEMRSSLLSSVEVLDGQPTLQDLTSVIEESLRLMAPRGKVAEAREILEGWWWPRVCSILAPDSYGRIAISELETRLDEIREMFRRDALIVTFEHAVPPDEDIAEYEGFRFVAQLRAVGIGSARIWAAKRDYYRAFCQRSQWLREHVVLDGEVSHFEERLIEEWEAHFSAMCDEHGHCPQGDMALQAAGQQVYRWVEQDARFPFRTVSLRFLTVGSYNMLSNDLRVGWHRDYLTLCGDRGT